MSGVVLALRLSRRALGAAALDDESITFADGRHLTSRRHQAEAAAMRYIATVVEQTHPTCLSVLTPARVSGVAAALVDKLRALASAHGVSLEISSTSEVLNRFSTRPLRSRAQLHEIIERFCPAVARVVGQVRPYVADAAAAALLTDVARSFQPPS